MQRMTNKGVGLVPDSTTSNSKPGSTPWNLLNEDVSLPAAVLNRNQLDKNIKWMQEFSNNHGLALSPHGKTTMCPYIFHRQLQAGAWGITLATVSQVKLAHSFGVRKILMANQLIGKCNMEILSEIITSDPTFEFICLVDSAQNVKQIGQFFDRNGLKVKVLLEYGYHGGRTGIRNSKQEEEVLSALSKYHHCLHLVGVEFYEALLKKEEDVRSFIQWVLLRTEKLAMAHLFRDDSIIVSAAGSSWLDVVAKEFSSALITSQVNIQPMIRPGSYLTHEVGTYHGAKERMEKALISCNMSPALSVWAYVQSIPEPGFVILSLGKREIDASFDCEFPIPKMHYKRCKSTLTLEAGTQAPLSWKMVHIMDQHSFMTVNDRSDNDEGFIQVGDVVSFEIPYPGTTLDKFKNILIVDNRGQVLIVADSFF